MKIHPKIYTVGFAINTVAVRKLNLHFILGPVSHLFLGKPHSYSKLFSQFVPNFYISRISQISKTNRRIHYRFYTQIKTIIVNIPNMFLWKDKIEGEGENPSVIGILYVVSIINLCIQIYLFNDILMAVFMIRDDR